MGIFSFFFLDGQPEERKRMTPVSEGAGELEKEVTRILLAEDVGSVMWGKGRPTTLSDFPQNLIPNFQAFLGPCKNDHPGRPHGMSARSPKAS